MVDVVKISVDGQDGDLVARSSGIRLVTPNNDLTLVRRGENRDGLPGTNASRATPGAPAGFLAVDLSESATTDEGITVQTLGFTSRQEPPEYLELPARRDLMLSAVGGRAESGHNGGNGQAGMNGIDGTPATREVDATPGTDGGNGGDAGQGTNGADGGNGGTIEISVDEDDTHLLFAAQWDVRGGVGGAPGVHGQPGDGGRGGIGGAGHRWREIVGYKYHCTSNCIGDQQSSTETSLVRAGSVMNASALALLAPIRAQAVEGGNLPALIASVAQRYGARRFERTDPGSCQCKGGTGNCYGCESVPIHKDFQRIPGRNGRDGRPGQSINTPLYPGSPGHPGSATIHVRNHDGSQQQYTSRYQLELLDFDVEDENGDGIFEPGEYAFIRRIRIQNTGGMPSPKGRIPISAIASEWFLPVGGEESYTLTPSSIIPGVAVVLEGYIKVLIRQSDDLQPSGKQFFRREHLSVQATMPWLNRTLPYFEYSRVIDIQYPVELRSFHFLSSMAQGSVNRFSFEILNRSSKALGNMSNSRRHIETHITFPEDCGALQSFSSAWESEVDHQITVLPAKQSVPKQQTLRIASDAQSYRHVAVQVDLYLSVPLHEPLRNGTTEVDMQLIQQNDLLVQISSHHVFNERSDFLLVTNSNVSRDRVQSIQNLIRGEFDMETDEWNVSLYGGLQYQPGSPEAAPDYVMEKYRGKTIIFIGNQFEYFRNGVVRNACELCDPRILAEDCAHGTGCLFLESTSLQAFRNLAGALILPVHHQTERILEHQMASHNFESRSALIESLKQHKVVNGSPSTAVYTLPVKHRWYRLSKEVGLAEAKKLAKILRQQLPGERFLVTAIKHGDPAQPEEFLVVLHGLPQSVDFLASEAQLPGSNISPFEAFMIADSVPSSTQVNIVWSLPANSSPSSPFTFRAISLSLLLGLNTEIRNFLHKAAWPNAIQFPSNSPANTWQAPAAFLSIHLPLLAQLFQHPVSQTADPLPEHILELLSYSLVSCRPQKKRHLARNTIMPFAQRRRQLYKLLLSAVEALLSRKIGDNAKYRKKFYDQTKALHSRLNKDGKRDTRKSIMRMVSEFTKCSEHTFSHGQLSARNVVPRTEYCTREEWDRRWEAAERERERILRETREAWDVLGKLTVEA